MKLRALLLILVAAVLLAAPALWADDDAQWLQAQRVYDSAYSQYSQRNYEQAAGLFEEFVKKHPTHEAVPQAYLYLSHCYASLSRPVEAEKALDDVIRLFDGAPQWFVAYGSKLRRLHAARVAAETDLAAQTALLDKAKADAAKRKPDAPPQSPTPEEIQAKIDALQKQIPELRDAYISLANDFARKAKILPFDVSYNVQLQPGWSWYKVHDGDRRRYPYNVGWLQIFFRGADWEGDLVDAADTPERAQQALRAIDGTIRKMTGELPPSWQWAHVALIRKSGRGSAEKQLKDYAAEWGDDPRGMVLWVLWGESLQSSGDDQAADAAFAHVAKAYMGHATLSAALAPRFAYLATQQRYDDFAALARQFLATYPGSREKGRVLNEWLRMLRVPAAQGDQEAFVNAKKLLEEHWGAENPYTVRWLLDLYVQMGKGPEAAEVARYYLDEKHWTSEVYDTFARNYVPRCEALKPVFAEMLQKYGIPAANPDGPAAKVLADLKQKIKEDQVRWIEELGDTLYTEHRATAEAIEAATLLVDYYFRKVLPAPRDKWVLRMVEAWPIHPDTHRVMVRQAEALYGQKRFPDLARVLDLMDARFPQGKPWWWFHRRFESYEAAKDYDGRLALLKRWHGESAAEGDVWALAEIARREIDSRAKDLTTAEVGQFWMDKAEQYKNTRSGLYALHEAVTAYFTLPRHHPHLGRQVLPDEALSAVKQLQDQTLDPEVAWNAEFRDIEILADQNQPRRAMELLAKRVGAQKKIRDLTLRLDLGTVARGCENDTDLARQALELAKVLEKATYTTRDRAAIERFKGHVMWKNGAPEQGEKCYWEAVKLYAIPAMAYGDFRGAMECARVADHGGATKMYAAAEKYIRTINKCQDLIPRILLEVGRQAVVTNSPLAARIRSRLASEYPDSSSRGLLEDFLREHVKKQMEKKNG